MRGLQLIATGGAKPGRVVTNEELSHQVDTSDAWITCPGGYCLLRCCHPLLPHCRAERGMPCTGGAAPAGKPSGL